MPLVSNTAPGNFVVDGAYVSLVAAQPVTPSGPQTGLIAVVGGGNWGKKNYPLPFTDSPSAFSQFGSDTKSSHSLIREALNAMPEGQQFLGVRVTDGSDAAATIVVLDASGGTVDTATAVYTGSYPNAAAGLRFDLQSGDFSGTTGVPVLRATQFFPNALPQVFPNIIAGNGSGYVAATFRTNFKAAINGTVANQQASSYFTDAGTGASSLPPVLATVFLASGGVDGTTSLTTGQMMGAPSGTGGMGTGVYSLSSMVSAAQVILAALTDGSVAQALNSFAVQENCIVWVAFPSGQSTANDIQAMGASNMVADSLFLGADWDFQYDAVQQLTVLTSPIGKLAGMIAAQPEWQYPGNQAAAVGVTATDRISGGVSTINGGEAGQRESNGILYLGYMPQSLRGPQLGLPHAMTSTGRLISDIRMMKSIAFSLQALLGKYVGGMNNPNNLDQLTIKYVRDAIDGFFQNMMIGQTPKIANYQNVTDRSNNSVLSIQQGFIISAIAVETLSAARFILAFVQVGNTVQIVTQSIQGAAA